MVRSASLPTGGNPLVYEDAGRVGAETAEAEQLPTPENVAVPAWDEDLSYGGQDEKMLSPRPAVTGRRRGVLITFPKLPEATSKTAALEAGLAGPVSPFAG